jgi:hypothetical protein
MINLATLLWIQPAGIPKPAVLRYQNYRRLAPIVFDGQNYDWAPFQIESEPNTDLQLSSAETMISIGRSAALDTVLDANNDLKKAVVIFRLVQPGITELPIGRKKEITYVTREGGSVLFTLKPITNARTGNTVTKVVDRREFQNLPEYRVRF